MYFCNVKNVASISIFLVLVLLSSITITSLSNINKLIVVTELAEEETSRNKSKSSNQNLLEEEEQHGIVSCLLLPVELDFKSLSFSFYDLKMSLIHIEIITPPPLFLSVLIQ